jgi:AraC family transcriptional regulator of adaptative response/methylated-DNA-[protein]-cysteine methyltransferase
MKSTFFAAPPSARLTARQAFVSAATSPATDSAAPLDDRWAAVTARDRRADGEFVYAVRTTGVYCRPSCPSRAARRENVTFHDTTHQARAAGFRACRRCRPDESSLEPPGQRIRFAVQSCALGLLLVAATPKGVCSIEFGDAAPKLIERLRERFPKAVFEADDAALRQWVGAMLAWLDRPAGLPDLPLDIQGTVFRQRVWQALRAIPVGATTSYARLAESIGEPRAARAVAQACASNPLAVAVPCHRVVRSDGALSGYRWGTARKAELLRREQQP